METPGQSLEQKNKKKIIVIGVFFFLFISVIATSYYGSTDVGDYYDVTKFFAGDYRADIRNTHSYLYGFILAPLYRLFGAPLIFKITSLLFLGILIFSVYWMSGKEKRVLFLMLFSPLVWYMGPWTSPIQLASIFLLWAYFFIKKYDEVGNIKHLALSGITLGLGWAFWDTIFYFGFFLSLFFLYDKKTLHSIGMILFVGVGLLPRLLLDQFLFGSPIYTLIKTFVAGFVSLFAGGIYATSTSNSWVVLDNLLGRGIAVVMMFFSIPFFFWRSFRKSDFLKNKKPLLFILLSLFIILSNPQIRYLLALIPIITLMSFEFYGGKWLKKQLALFILLIIFLSIPYLIQTKYQINTNFEGEEIVGFLRLLFTDLNLSETSVEEQIIADLNEIEKDFEGHIFIVGNKPDDYAILARLYEGKRIQEFVSIQDYQLFLRNDSILYRKTWTPLPRFRERRQIWIEGGLRKNPLDDTDFSEISYAIGYREPVILEGFKIDKEYRILYVSRREP